MDLGVVVAMNGLVGSSSSESGGVMLLSSTPDNEANRNKGLLFGSGFLEQKRTSGGGGPEVQDWRCQKMARTEQMLMPTTDKVSSSSSFSTSHSLLRSNSQPLLPEGQQMLSFSSSKMDPLVLCNEGGFSYYNPSSSSLCSTSTAYVRNTAGLGSGGLNASMDGVLAGVRGPFTHSQWMELEHQAMIYKYIDANAPIPSSLILSIKQRLAPSGYPGGYSVGSLPPSAYFADGWGPFQLGFSGNTDPEPGRCRRTDGKKWRCSRDAVADQKYCERHMNRGRHRSRKPVEGLSGHAKPMPIIAPSAAQQQLLQKKSLLPGSADPSPTLNNRNVVNKENANCESSDLQQSLSMSMLMNPKPKESIPSDPFEQPSLRTDFGLVSSNSLVNLPNPHMDHRALASATALTGKEPHPLRHFMEEWPKSQSDHSTMTWADAADVQLDRTQLSISTPVAPSTFSPSSPATQEKLNLSQLKLSRELDPIHIGLGMGSNLDNESQRQAGWMPMSWGASMGGPLGEVLNSTNKTGREFIKYTSALNLMTDGWDSSPRMDSSPTGVLQKSAFGSLSNSTGSSPRAENYGNHDTSGSLCDELIGSTRVNSASLPST